MDTTHSLTAAPALTGASSRSSGATLPGLSPRRAVLAWARGLVKALAASALLATAGPACAEADGPARPATFVPAAQAWARVLPPPTQRELRVRAALQRAVAAPRVAALVREILPADVQVVVVDGPPDGLGAYYPGLAVAGYEHVHANERARRLISGSWGLIVLDARLEELASRETIAFVLAHEYGHHRLERGHTEADADLYAKRLLVPLGLWSPAAAQDAFEMAVGLPFARRIVPAIGERLRALEESLQVAMPTPHRR